MKHLFVSLILVLALSSTLLSQGFNSKQIDSLVDVAMNTMPHAGLSVLVVKDGKVIHSKGYGLTSVDSKQKVNEHTGFAIASNSKAFTSAALAILVDAGKLDWNDKVVEHVPEFKMYDPYVTANFTIIDLLTHRSGMALGAGDLMFFPDGGNFTIDDILKSFQYQKQVSEFRTKFDYDNLLYIVAGEVIHRISGLSWSEFIEQRIMKPLGMTGCAGKLQRLKDKSNIAIPHSTINGKLTPLGEFNIGEGAAAGGIYANVNDLSKWVMMHLNQGKYGDKTLISEKNHSIMWKPYTNRRFNLKPDPKNKIHFDAYGLAWGINDINGYIQISHTGGLPGMLSKTTLIPELNLGVVVLTNADPGGYSFQSISKTIIDSYLEIKGNDHISKMGARIKKRATKADAVTAAVWKTVKEANSHHLKLSDYIGMYKDDWFGNVEVYEKSGQLMIRCLRSPKLSGPMAFYKANTFAIKWDFRDMECNAFASFMLDQEGKASGFTMKGISPSIDFSFDFQHLKLQRVK